MPETVCTPSKKIEIKKSIVEVLTLALDQVKITSCGTNEPKRLLSSPRASNTSSLYIRYEVSLLSTNTNETFRQNIVTRMESMDEKDSQSGTIMVETVAKQADKPVSTISFVAMDVEKAIVFIGEYVSSLFHLLIASLIGFLILSVMFYVYVVCIYDVRTTAAPAAQEKVSLLEKDGFKSFSTELKF